MRLLASVLAFSTPLVAGWDEALRPVGWERASLPVAIVEGDSPEARALGFAPGGGMLSIRSIADARNPSLDIVWRDAVSVPRMNVPEGAIVFARERWTGAPVLAGVPGKALWAICGPGETGSERFPYLLQALTDLGAAPPFESRRLWAFFDYAYRMRIDVDYFAARWRKAGIAALHVSAWHFHEPDPGRDAYLRRLIDACHRNAILVYAWLELPHVSERFWAEHPEWREKTATLDDAHLDWRKLMNLTNRDCFRAVSQGVAALLDRFDWDGVNIAELYFESLQGAADPARFTPMNDDVRRLYRERIGRDPAGEYASREFLEFRVDLARRMQQEWLAEADEWRKSKPDLDVVLTHVDDRLDPAMRDAIGVDASRVLPLLGERRFTFLIEDPATTWHLGPERYTRLAEQYAKLTPSRERLGIDINIVERYQDVYPAKQQTGIELFQLVRRAAESFDRVALYFESSLLGPDLSLLPAAAAVARRSGEFVDARHAVGVRFGSEAIVNGHLWPWQSDGVIWLPVGRHVLHPGKAPAGRLLDFNGEVLDVRSLEGGIRLRYRSGARAIAVLNRSVIGLGTTVILAAGEHEVDLLFEEPPLSHVSGVDLRSPIP